jgi:hypothetical protein
MSVRTFFRAVFGIVFDLKADVDPERHEADFGAEFDPTWKANLRAWAREHNLPHIPRCSCRGSWLDDRCARSWQKHRTAHDPAIAQALETRALNEERTRREWAESQERERVARAARIERERAECAAKGVCFKCRRPLNEHGSDGQCIPCAQCGHSNNHEGGCGWYRDRMFGPDEDCSCSSFVRRSP